MVSTQLFILSSGLVHAASRNETFSFYIEAKGGYANSGHLQKSKTGSAVVKIKRISSSCSPNLLFSMRMRETNTNEIASNYVEFNKNYTGTTYMPYVSGKGELKKVYHLRIRTPYGSSQSAWADGTLKV